MKHDEKWEQTFALLQEYYAEYGAFPIAGEIYHNVNLGKWCANQKLQVKAGKCSEERLTKLQGVWVVGDHLGCQMGAELYVNEKVFC